jgi:protein ImuB
MTRTIAIVFPEWKQHYESQGEHYAFTQFEHVVRAVSELSPLVEVEDAGIMVLSARGPTRYFGGEDAVARRLFDVCGNQEVPCGVGIASSRFAARAAALLSVSRATPCVIHHSVSQQFLHALPVGALEKVGSISPHTVSLLQRLGLSRCGDVHRIGESALIDRFGNEGRSVWQLVNGEEVRHLAPGSPPSDFACSLDFESPLSVASHVVSASLTAIQSVVAAIAAHGQQCVRVLLECETDHAETSTRVWGEPRGFDSASLAQRVLYQLDGWLVSHDADPDAPTSGIVRVRLVPLECREVLAVQPLLWGGNEENIERALRAASMAQAVHSSVVVTVPQWEGGRDITQVYSHVPLSMVNIADSEHAQQRVTEGRGVARRWTGSVPQPSPTCIFPEPHPALVVDEHGEHVAVSGRHELTTTPAFVSVAGYRYTVEGVAGPWPVEERWWDSRRRRRCVRMQMLVRTQRNTVRVFLLSLENSEWKVLARYD